MIQEKNTIRDGGSTALKAAYTVDIVDAIYTIQTALHCSNSSNYAIYENSSCGT